MVVREQQPARLLDAAVARQAQQLARPREAHAGLLPADRGPSAARRPRTAASSPPAPAAGTGATMNGGTCITSASGPSRRASRSACSPLPSASTTSAARLRGSRQAAFSAAASMAAGVAGGS